MAKLKPTNCFVENKEAIGFGSLHSLPSLKLFLACSHLVVRPRIALGALRRVAFGAIESIVLCVFNLFNCSFLVGVREVLSRLNEVFIFAAGALSHPPLHNLLHKFFFCFGANIPCVFLEIFVGDQSIAFLTRQLKVAFLLNPFCKVVPQAIHVIIMNAAL